jgi:hypothetical protein
VPKNVSAQAGGDENRVPQPANWALVREGRRLDYTQIFSEPAAIADP